MCLARFVSCIFGTTALIAVASDRLPEIVAPKQVSWGGDLSLRIEYHSCDAKRQCSVVARGSHHGRTVGIEVIFGVIEGARRGMVYRSIGPESDALLQAMAEIYKLPAPEAAFSEETYADLVVLEGDDQAPMTRPLKAKAFFYADGPDSRYAEIYTNVIPATDSLELLEKDEGYRENILKAFAAQGSSQSLVALVSPNHCMQPTLQPVIKFAYANLSPVWCAADAGC